MSSQSEKVRYQNEQDAAVPPEWEEPDCYDLNVAADRRQMYGREMMQLAEKHGRVEALAHELFEVHHPDRQDDPAARERFVSPIIAQGDRFGKWFYFPWSNQLVQYPDEDEWYKTLTFRNQNLITADEQQRLRHTTILHAGQSVGMKVLHESVHMGIGNKLIIGDPDRLSPTNLNRINGGMEQVGMRKIDIASIHVSELNPYIKQIRFPEGINQRNLNSVISWHRPDLMYEHVDHLPTKILMRRVARQARIALIMATDLGDRSLIDVERYDNDESVRPFLGLVSESDLAGLEKGNLPADRAKRVIYDIFGYENVSMRMAQSMGQIGITLGGIAQESATAAAGAAYATFAGRNILLGERQESGRYKLSPREILQTPNHHS